MGPHARFEEIRYTNAIGQEFWSARQWCNAFAYTKWDKLLNVVKKAKKVSKNPGIEPEDHFPRMEKLGATGSRPTIDIGDFHLSRYACYLIVQNADPSKAVVAMGQTYFAIQTRKQEVFEEQFGNIQAEEENRLFLRREMAAHNKYLAVAVKKVEVISPWEYAVFQNHGYMDLYNRLGAKEIHTKKGLKKSQNMLGHRGSTALAINLFRATQTEEKVKRENTKG